MTAVTATALSDRLPAYSLYAMVLSGAGLPIYIYAPKFFADNYGVSLTALGAVLFGLRLFDVVQDPLLGWISERLNTMRKAALAAGAGLLALSMIGLFAITPLLPPLVWFGLTITGLFSAFSFLTINFYAQGVGKAQELQGGHIRLAAWRETGALLGVCLAAVSPTLLVNATSAPFAVFALGFAVLTLIAAAVMAQEWTDPPQAEATPIGVVLSDPTARRLLLLSLVNAAPLAVSSTLFLFYVESLLGASGWDGPLLVLFFLSAAFSAPVWSAVAARVGAKRTLLAAMALAICAFGTVLTLGEGDIFLFAVICVASGASIGADLTLLPALFAQRMGQISPNAGQGFGLWSFTSKFTLAFAAVLLLPLLEAHGFEPGPANPASALTTLTLLYALVPCLLKLVAIILLSTTKLENR